MAEAEKSKRSKGLLIGLAVFLLWAIGAAIVVVFVVNRPPDFSESPMTTRDIPNFDADSPIGLLEKSDLPPRNGRPATEPFVKPVRIDGEDDGKVLHWQGEEDLLAKTLPERMATGLLDDDAIELFAFATWTPSADDKIEVVEESNLDTNRKSVSVTNGDWKAPLTFRDPTTLKAFSTEQLDELKIPQSFRTAVPPEQYKTGVIRLLFRSANMNAVRFVGGDGGDSITSAKVTYSLDSLESEPDQASVGEWSHYDFALLLWHDKPLTFHVQVLTGEPVYADLPQQFGEQVVFGEWLRLQWLARESGYFDSRFSEDFVPQPDVDHGLLKGIADETEHSASIIDWDDFEIDAADPASLSALAGTLETSAPPRAQPKAKTDSESADPDKAPTEYKVDSEIAAHIGSRISSDGTTEPETIFRISDEKYVDHLGRIDSDGSITWDFSGESDSGQIQFATCKHTKKPGDPLRLVFLPQFAELTFEIAGTPDLPNPRNIEDLFDQKIPRLTLSGATPDNAEEELIQFIAVATQSGVEHTDLWEEGWPSSMPKDHTFRDTTPQLLLNWYLQTSREAHVKQEFDLHLLLVNQDEETFWDKVMNFIDGL